MNWENTINKLYELHNVKTPDNNSRNNITIALNNFGCNQIFKDYPIPFIIGHSDTTQNRSWKCFYGTTVDHIKKLFELDKWFGNEITKIIHDLELKLRRTILNKITDQFINDIGIPNQNIDISTNNYLRDIEFNILENIRNLGNRFTIINWNIFLLIYLV